MSDDDFHILDLLIGKKTWQRIRKPVIGTYLFLQICIFVMFLALPNAVVGKILEPVQRVTGFLCLYQAYGVFSPNPAITNSHMMATILYKDGSMRIYPMIRIDRLHLLDKLHQERHRKFLEDNLPQVRNEYLMPDVARWVARHCNELEASEPGAKNSSNVPVMVTLICCYSDVPPLREQKPNIPQHNERVLCSYAVKAEDLEE